MLLATGLNGPRVAWALSAAEPTARLRWWQELAGRAAALRTAVHPLVTGGLAGADDFAAARPVSAWQAGAAARYAALAAAADLVSRSAVDTRAVNVGDVRDAAAALAQVGRLAGQVAEWGDRLGVDVTTLRSDQVAAHRGWVAAVRRTTPGPVADWLVRADDPVEQVQA